MTKCPWCGRSGCYWYTHLTPVQILEFKLEVARMNAKREHKTFEEYMNARLPEPTDEEKRRYKKSQEELAQYRRKKAVEEWLKKKLQKQKDLES